MSSVSTDIWASHETNPLLWMATASVAFVAHLGLLQMGITAYQMQVSATDAAPATETKIIATALQVAGAKTPPPPQLEATPLSVETSDRVTQQESLQAETLTPQTLSAATSSSQAAESVQTLSPAASATPEPERQLPVEATTESAITEPDQDPAPISPIQRAQAIDAIAPLALAPQTPLNQPGVAPLAIAPAATSQAAQLAPKEDEETLEVTALDAPIVEALPETRPDPVPTPEQAPEIAVSTEPETTVAPLPPLANSLPLPPEGALEAQPGVATANAPEQSSEQAQQTYDTVLDFLRSFDGGACFAALPVLAEDGAFRFETFAQSRVDLTRFRQALELETGTLPGTVMKPISDAQCRALPFVTAAERYPEFQLYFDLSARDIPSGEVLSGRLGNTSGGFVSLLLIDDEGVVQDLGSFLKFRPGYAGFDIPMTLKGSPVQTQQLLMALSTKARLRTLASLSGQQAQDVFPKLALEILLQGGGEDVALVAFSVR